MEQNEKRELHRAWICRVREGDQSSFALLLADYESLIAAEVLRLGSDLPVEDQQDLRQVALLAFYRAVLGFDLSRLEVSFGLYAKICVHNALISQLRIIRRRATEIPVAEEPEPCDCETDPAHLLMEEEAAAALHARIRKVLSPYENRVWNLYTAGYHVGEIAALLSKEPHSVENAVYRIRRKLRVALGGRA